MCAHIANTKRVLQNNMGSQQIYGKHQNCNDLPNILSELLEFEGLENVPIFRQYYSSDGNSFSNTIDHNEADHDHDQQSGKIPKSPGAATSPVVDRTEFLISSRGHHHVLGQGKKSASEENGVVFYSSSKELAPRISTNKQRIKWTEDLHEQFVDCVNLLGGAKKATPRKILKLMNKSMLTIFHVKSHLQKYRTSRAHIADYTKEKSENQTTLDGTNLDMKSGMQIKEALQHVNRLLHEQLEIQQNLRLLIEEQGKQLKMMLQPQQKTNSNLFMKSMQIPDSQILQNDPCNSLNDDHFSLTECSGSSQLQSDI